MYSSWGQGFDQQERAVDTKFDDTEDEQSSSENKKTKKKTGAFIVQTRG